MKLIVISFLLLFNISNSQEIVNNDTIKKTAKIDSIPKINYDDLYTNINLKNLRGFLGKEIPYFVVKDINGNEFDSSKTKRLVIYSFWFSGCAACIGEIDILNALQQKFNDQVDFISITFDSKLQIEEFVKKHPSNFRHLSVEKSFIEKLDLNGGYPRIILASEGKIIKYQLTGINSQKTVPEKLFSFGTYYKFRSAIEQALATMK
jgi:cytochrome c biogenesis protein CcmG/thiol:disulfide interchange protein DsbE